MNTINRTVVLITAKEPYIDWANSFDGGPKMSITKQNNIAILIPDTYDENNYEKWLKKNYRNISTMELESWMMVPESFPEILTYKVFQEWFEVRVADSVFDFGNSRVVTEEY